MARFNRGWVKAWREQVDGDLPQNIWLWGIWHWLLLTATWRPTKILWNGKQREIPPGTVVMGLAELSAKWECSKNTIKKWLKYLEESERIHLETCTRGTIVTIRNWDVYQSRDDETCTPSEREVNADCTRSEHEVTLNEEVKKGRKKESKKIHVGIRAEYPQEFDELWGIYGRRGDKKAAFEEYKKLKLADDEKLDLAKAVKNYVEKVPDVNFRKHLERFLKTDWRELVNPETGSYDWSQLT